MCAYDENVLDLSVYTYMCVHVSVYIWEREGGWMAISLHIASDQFLLKPVLWLFVCVDLMDIDTSVDVCNPNRPARGSYLPPSDDERYW